MNSIRIKLTILLFTVFAFTSLVVAQTDFEGKVIYTISYKDLPEEMKAMEGMLAKNMTIVMKGSKSRVEQSQMMGKNVVVSDMDQKNGFMEMDMAGQKFRINISTEEFEQKSNQLPNIEYLDETKTIAGYPCKKAIMKDENGLLTMTVFYTEKITNKSQTEFAGLKGFPLQYSMQQQNMTMEMTATQVTKESISDDAFKKSDGYQEITQADLQKMMGGGY
jgi:GLPGLI family protein